MKNQLLLRSLTTTYKHTLWAKFVKAIETYHLIDDKDHICVCVSGGKDSLLMALLFQLHQRVSQKNYRISFLVMNPGFQKDTLAAIQQILHQLSIDAQIFDTDIFEVMEHYQEKNCFLCAKMRRGALYSLAQKMCCNKIALGHHYNDVNETTLMNVLYAGSFQTMLPKLKSDHFSGMELIRPMYLIKEEHIIDFMKTNHIQPIQCACRFTTKVKNKQQSSARAKVKELIQTLSKENPDIEKNLFSSIQNVYLDKVLGYKKDKQSYSYLDEYDK